MRWLDRRRGAGCLVEQPDGRDLDIDALGLASSDVPLSFSLAAHEPPIRNQGSTNTCVAQALAAAIDIRESLAGLPHDPVSELSIYWNSRRLHGSQMIDAGTYVRTACESLRHVGACPRQYWPWSKRHLSMHRRPGTEAYMKAHPRRGGRYYRIAEQGEARLLAIRSAISSGFPVVFGTTITDAFQRSDGAWLIDRPNLVVETPVGGHAMVLTGYDTESFRTLNSWGTRWRGAGVADLSNAYVSWYQTRDFWIIDGWDRLRGER